MSVKRYSVGYTDSASGRYSAMLDNKYGGYVRYEDYAALEQQLAESHRALRAETTAHENTQMRLEKMAAENAGLKGALSKITFTYPLSPHIHGITTIKTPATDAYLAEVRENAITDYANKRGFSFQHGSIHAHFGNGDVMVGAVTFENGDAGINFAPVREKTGGVGTSYEWTRGKTAEQVDSVFVIGSSNAEGLEVIRDKLSEAIDHLRKGVQS